MKQLEYDLVESNIDDNLRFDTVEVDNVSQYTAVLEVCQCTETEVYPVPNEVVIKDWAKLLTTPEKLCKILLITNGGHKEKAVIIKRPMTNRFSIKSPPGEYHREVAGSEE